MKRRNVILDSLLLIVKVVYGELILWRNLFHSRKLNRGQYLIRNRRISALIIKNPAHVKMIATVWRVKVAYVEFLNHLGLSQLLTQSVSDWGLFCHESLLDNAQYLSRLFEKCFCGERAEINIFITLFNFPIILDLLILTTIITLNIDLYVLSSYVSDAINYIYWVLFLVCFFIQFDLLNLGGSHELFAKV